MNFDWGAVASALPDLGGGLKLTILIALCGICGGLVIGAVAGAVLSYSRFLTPVANAYVGLIRGTPIVVQVMFIYFALPMMADIKMSGFAAASLTIAVNSGAFFAEIFRGALQSVPRGMYEAALAMGLPFWRILTYVLAPLALRRAIPPLGNQVIASVKDTSIFLVIGVAELTREGQAIMASNFKAIEIWSTVAVIYLLLITCIAAMLRLVERGIATP
ncbi:ABC transporter permease subunit [Paraburkholderia sp. BCC1885]|uniref:ABC transporter permease subunit n=1 Tax=Paraburkholderia sp. BCC1885 TaxID=2562669 RepID=UPI001181F5F2|nr:ABC transporter permease subunit [Paraburkholderia sp. BCC1885]